MRRFVSHRVGRIGADPVLVPESAQGTNWPTDVAAERPDRLTPTFDPPPAERPDRLTPTFDPPPPSSPAYLPPSTFLPAAPAGTPVGVTDEKTPSLGIQLGTFALATSPFWLALFLTRRKWAR